jgi:hypothetical protein
MVEVSCLESMKVFSSCFVLYIKYHTCPRIGSFLKNEPRRFT